MNDEVKQAIDMMIGKITNILADDDHSIYIYGSCTLGDFKLGWSDIDLLILTQKTIGVKQAEALVNLRQALLENEPDNLYYRLFEGGMLSLNAFKNSTTDRVVYWGTSGQRVQNEYIFNFLSRKELLDYGVLLAGKEIRNELSSPTYSQLKSDIQLHYDTIRKHCVTTSRSIYSFGWMLDISRCIFTLQTGEITSKTKAGEWALSNGLCPDKKALEKSLDVRRNPALFKTDCTVQDYSTNLGYAIQQYADILEQYL